jgi:single-strand DNA-binding protein
MQALNKVTLIGLVGKDPDARYTQEQQCIVNLTLATHSSWKDKKTQQKHEETEWHRLVFFGRLAEVCAQYVQKGAKIYVEGKLRTRKWQDKEGIDRYTTEIHVDELIMLDRRDKNDPSSDHSSADDQ